MTTTQEAAGKRPKTQLIIVLIVLAAFGVVLGAKAVTGGDAAGTSEATPTSSGSGGPSMTSVRNDAVADYETALKTGLPIYLLFHSLTCEPCVEISAVADEVLPAYEGRVAFVNAITDDPSAQQLASEFTFQYIPTSFFLKPGGEVADSHTGTLTQVEMRASLDALVPQ